LKLEYDGLLSNFDFNFNLRRYITDKNLRVKGSEGTIFALGDCATIERPRSLSMAEDLYRSAAKCTAAGRPCHTSLATSGMAFN
jgi:NADH:ubiquinone reductase (non-electrogenic)